MSLGDRRLRCPVGDGGGAPGAGAPPPGPADALAGVVPVQTAQHALTLLPGMDAVLRSIFGDVERATRRVDVETYIYRDDVLGSSFADVMGRAAARGVRARLLYDPLGSHETDGPFFEALRRRGIEVRAYRPLAVLLGAGGLLPRDHARVIASSAPPAPRTPPGSRAASGSSSTSAPSCTRSSRWSIATGARLAPSTRTPPA
jgi:cardiolipin synthase